MTPYGWSSIDDGLSIGTQIGIPKYLPEYGNADMPEKEVELLALLLADGSITEKMISYTKKNAELVEIAKGCASYFGTELTNANEDRLSWLFAKPQKHGINQFLQEHGLLGCTSATKFIPAKLFCLKPALRKRFIELLVSGDGSVMQNYIEYSSVSEELVRGLGTMLLGFGIKYSIRSKETSFTYKGEKRKGKTAWILTIRGDDAERFMQEFTLIKEKACNFVKGTDDRKHVNIKLSEKQLDEIWQVFDGRIKDLTVALGCKLQGEYQNKGLISKK